MQSKPAYNQATKASAVDGEVVLDGPDGVGLSMTPEAAEETARRLAAAAAEAKAQRDGSASADPASNEN